MNFNISICLLILKVCFLILYKPGIFFAILGRGPRAFLIGKISEVRPKFGKVSKHSKMIFSNLTYLIKVTHFKLLNNNL